MSDSNTTSPPVDITTISDMQEATITNNMYEVAIIHDEHGELGTLDGSFGSEFDASMAAHNAAIYSVGITTEIRTIE